MARRVIHAALVTLLALICGADARYEGVPVSVGVTLSPLNNPFPTRS
jgi:hypothetical protein